MLRLKTVSSMEKCFADEDFAAKRTLSQASALRGEDFAFELLYDIDEAFGDNMRSFTLRVESPLADAITVREVVDVPVRMAAYPYSDDYFLRKEPGMYPDLLQPMDRLGSVYACHGILKALYVTVQVPEDLAGGDYPITLRFMAGDEVAAETTFTLHVIAATLPKQEIIVTEWFHTDCIADYYGLEVYSDTHWEYIKNFMKTAVDNGINAILTPIFTPALDTYVGGERTTVQLIDVWQDASAPGGWRFGLERLDRWVQIALDVGVEYFEISHLYTQWGVEHAPKVMGYNRDGDFVRLFGWETDACSDEYKGFLRVLIPEIIAFMKARGLDKKCLWHISDEPGLAHLENYKAAKAQIADLLEGYVIMDALSNFEFYQTGAVDCPIPANNHIEPFLEAGVPNLWTYYCCGQTVDVSNRLVAMPNQRTRIIGAQFWKYNIAGFLQWGYNFYNSMHSVNKINPYVITDGGYWVPAGDCFSVYPGIGGEVLETLHLKGFTQALTDLRAMKLAETLCGREAVQALVDAEGEITFSSYPHREGFVDELREQINALIARAL